MSGNEARTGHPWGRGPQAAPGRPWLSTRAKEALLLTRPRPQLLTIHELLVPQSSSLYSSCSKTPRGCSLRVPSVLWLAPSASSQLPPGEAPYATPLNSHKNQTRVNLPILETRQLKACPKSHDQSVPDSGLEPGLRSQSPACTPQPAHHPLPMAQHPSVEE